MSRIIPPEIAPYESLIDDILRAGAAKADEVEVYLEAGRSLSLELRQTVVGEASMAEVWGIGIRVITDGRIGSSSTMSPGRWEACLDAAVASARLADQQDWQGLPSPAPLPACDEPYDPLVVCDVALAEDLLSRTMAGAEGAEAVVIGGSASLSSGAGAIANSHDVFSTHRGTHAGVSLEMINGTSTGYEYDSTARLGDIDPEKVGEKAAFFADFWAGAGDVPSAEADVVFAPTALASLLSAIFFPALSGRNVHAGRSYFAGKLGEACLDPALHVIDDPHHGDHATPLDDDGVVTRPLELVRDGTVAGFAYDLKTAYRYGAKTTGNAVRGGAGGAPGIGFHNLTVEGPAGGVDDGGAIVCHGLVGAHTANTITGDFSVELSNASYVEDGEYTAPIRSAMLGGNLFAMLADIAGTSEETRTVGRIALPSVRFNNLHIIGK
ncbi:MAG TPA: TldD/PmbA family protein [Methanoculleus sp.]|nr:TldD/PmbA family protein [Methanoculleus sp.]